MSAGGVLWILFLALAGAWGSSFLFIKIGLDRGLPPLTLVSYRLWVATAFLLVVLRLTKGRLPTGRRALVTVGLLGLTNVAIPFALVTWGELYISSALASILNGLAPLFTIVIAAFFLADEPITLNRLTGLLVGFAGALLLLSPALAASPVATARTGGSEFLGELALAGASLAYGASAVYVRRHVSGRPLVEDPVRGPRSLTPVEIALPQSLVAAVVTTTLAFVLERPAGSAFIVLPPAAEALFAVSWLGIVGSGIAYLLYFRIVAAWGATRTSLVTYVMPIVGILLGVLMLRETLSAAEIAGSVLVLVGLVLANSRMGRRRLFAGGAAAPTVGTR